MPFSANPPDWPTGLGRHLLAEIDSTNAEALRRAAEGQGPQWILAARQTAGRGRRARAWQSPSGNFYASLLIYPEGGPERAALFSFAAALALRAALAACTGAEAALALKWPNDVLLAGRKIAGILLERQAQPGGRAAALAIGIGVNLLSAPPPEALEPGALAASSVLAETGQRLTPEALLHALAPRLDHWGGRLDREGFAPLRAAFLDKAAHLGQKVVARMGGRKEEGRFVTLDGQGALILEQSAGQIAISAADIFFS